MRYSGGVIVSASAVEQHQTIDYALPHRISDLQKCISKLNVCAIELMT